MQYRAILRNPSLILCDEVTSSVDAFAEKEIVSTLRSAAAHRTTVTVAHRLTSIVHCDQIIVLEKGKVVERGRHADLITIDNGVYKKMWEAQNNVFVDTNHVLPMQELDWFSLEEPEEENSGSFSYSAKDTQDVHIKPTTSYSMKV